MNSDNCNFVIIHFICISKTGAISGSTKQALVQQKIKKDYGHHLYFPRKSNQPK